MTDVATAPEAYDHWTRESLRRTDLDLLEHINHVAMINFLEDGWLAARRAQGLDPENNSLYWRAAAARVDFRAQIHFPGAVEVATRILGLRGNQLLADQAIFSDGKCAVTLRRTMVLCERATGAAQPLPHSWAERLGVIEGPAIEAVGDGGDRPSQSTDFPFWRAERLRFADLDESGGPGLAFHFTMLEGARMAFLGGVKELMKKGPTVWMVVHIEVDFHAPAPFPGGIDCALGIAGFSRSSCRFNQAILAGQTCLATAASVNVLVDRKSGRAIPIPADLRRDLSQRRGKRDRS